MAAFGVALATPPAASAHSSLAEDPGFAELIERLAPSVVSIVATREADSAPQSRGRGDDFRSPREFFEEFFFPRSPGRGAPFFRRPEPVRALGSGFVYDASGLIITADHTLGGADTAIDSLEVVFADGATARAEIVGRDARADIALLRVETEEPLVAVRFAEPGAARVGEWVVAMGNPLGVGGSATVGVISALNRDIGAGPYDEFIQTDAAVNRGNSGGPLFNARGEVVGVITSIYSPTGFFIGLAFAAPASTVAPVAAQLRASGAVRRAWIGVRIQGVSPEIARSLDLDKPRGALVVEVVPDSPAADAGLQGGDLILAFNDTAIERARDLSIAASRAPVGERARLTILRDDEERAVDVVLGELDEAALAGGATRETRGDGARAEYLWRALGVAVEPLDARAREELGLEPDAPGLRIVRLRARGPFDAVGAREGEAILTFAGVVVDSAHMLESLARRLARSGRDGGLAFLHGRRGARYVGVLLDATGDE